jgi:hypothetical protein
VGGDTFLVKIPRKNEVFFSGKSRKNNIGILKTCFLHIPTTLNPKITKKNYWIMLNGSKVSPKFVKNRLGGYRKRRRKVEEQVKSQEPRLFS